MGGVTMGGVTKVGGIDIGFNVAVILKKVIVEGLISDIVLVATEGIGGV